MPIYEFYSPQNHKIYSFYARSLGYAGKTPICPDNPKFKMERLISSFAVTGRAKEKGAEPAGGPADDAAMERVMAEMERDFSGMDDKNPDPRQLARMMRKMSDLTGEKMPETMEEMVRRMESGEDPEKLEEEYGDAIGDFDSGGGENENSPTEKSALARRRTLPPQRDPVLYEMADYIPK